METVGDTTPFCSVSFRSRDPALRRHGRAFLIVGAHGLTLASRDEDETWTASVPMAANAPLVVDPIGLVQERLGTPFEVDEMMSVTQWEARLAVAAQYRCKAVFLVGDAAHQFYPAGAHAANTGIADAVDLGWKLAATVNGWGGPSLLESYECERRPVALFNRELSAMLEEVTRRFMRLSQWGASREQLAGVLEQDGYQIDDIGVHFGQRYDSSPVVCTEPGPAPMWDWRRITATTWPGGRAPSVRLCSGELLFDRLGHDLSLVDLTESGVGAALVEEANWRGVPMQHLRIDDPAVRACWERELVLVRPDHHVAWRSDLPPPEWAAVLARVTGRSDLVNAAWN
jgi:hypothetical protein